MTDKFNPQFTPDTIDEQIDLATQKDEQNAHSTDRTIQALQQHYASSQDYSQSLERVWNRFSSQRPPLETVVQDVYSRQPAVTRGRLDRRGSQGRVEYSSMLLRRSGIVAAAVFLVFIVGGMLALPQLLHYNNQAALQTKNVTTTPTFSVIIGEQSIYSAIPADGGIVYLYTGISFIRAGQSQTLSQAQQFKLHSGKLVEVNSQKGGAKIWSYKGDLISTPLLFEGVLYVPGQAGLDALRASDHTVLWHQNISVFTPLAAINGTLYGFDQNASLEALNSSNGRLLWQSKCKFVFGIENGIVYATENSGYMNALRASDGTMLWRTQLVDNNVYVENGVVLLSTSSYGIRALNCKTGALLWSNEHINNIFASQNSIVYAVEGGSKNIIALRVNDGHILWRSQPVILHAIQLTSDSMYISDVQNNVSHLLVLDPNTGKIIWQAKTPGVMKLFEDGILYLDRPDRGDPTTFLALKASDGSLLWRRNDIDHLYNAFLQARDGVVYIMLTDNKTIVALKASDGTILARYKADAL